MVKREKAVFDTLNMLNFDVTKKCLVGEGWFLVFAKPQIREALQRATFDSNSQLVLYFMLWMLWSRLQHILEPTLSQMHVKKLLTPMVLLNTRKPTVIAFSFFRHVWGLGTWKRIDWCIGSNSSCREAELTGTVE